MAGTLAIFHLPPEVRVLIYDYAFEDVGHSSMFDSGTAYSPSQAPLMYVHPTITNELYPLLYKDHALVLPIQEPARYCKEGKRLTPSIDKISRMRRLCTEKIIVEISQTERVFSADEEEEESGPDDEPRRVWDSEDDEFARKLVDELVEMKDQFPSVETIQFIFWFGIWEASAEDWRDPLVDLQEAWGGVHIEIQLNIFDYVDENGGDGGRNWIQSWDREYEETGEVMFKAVDLNYREHQQGHYEGRVFDPRGWELEDFMVMDDDRKDFCLHKWNQTCRPLYVKTGPSEYVQ